MVKLPSYEEIVILLIILVVGLFIWNLFQEDNLSGHSKDIEELYSIDLPHGYKEECLKFKIEEKIVYEVYTDIEDCQRKYTTFYCIERYNVPVETHRFNETVCEKWYLVRE